MATIFRKYGLAQKGKLRRECDMIWDGPQLYHVRCKGPKCLKLLNVKLQTSLTVVIITLHVTLFLQT